MSDLAEFRASIVSALQGVNASGWDLQSGRVLEGIVPFSAATGQALWYSCLPSGSGGSGLLAVVGAGDGRGRLRVGLPTFSCSVDVYCALDSDTSDTLSGVTAVVEYIRRTVSAILNGGVTYPAPEFLRAGRVTVLHYMMKCEGMSCEAYTRWLRNESDAPVLNESGTVIFV